MKRCSLALSLLLVSCVSIDSDPGELADELPPLDGPTVEFDPASSIIPTPNNLLLDPTNGLVDIPAPQCGESPTEMALRELVLNALDGFGNFKAPLQIPVSEAVDPASLADSVKLVRMATAGVPADPLQPEEIPFFAFPGTSERISGDCASSETVDTIVLVPSVPLAGDSTYMVAVLDGLQTAAGEAYLPSVVWSLVRQAVNPVTIEGDEIVAERTPFDPADPAGEATLRGIDLLWNGHAAVLAFADAALGTERAQLLIVWSFNTQTTTAPMEPDVPGSLAANLPGDPLAGVTSITGGDTQAYLESVFDPTTCVLIGCAAVGDVLGGVLMTPNYQIDVPNPLAGGAPVPGPWPDPRTPPQNGDNALEILAFVPAAPPPAGGYPTIIYGHGLGGSKEQLFALAPQLAAAGFASVAMDWVAHGSRAVKTSDVAALGCDGNTMPTTAPQCYGPLLSSDLSNTRDNLRQSVLDGVSLAKSLGACVDGACGALEVAPARLGYVGHSLGGIFGSMINAVSPDLQASVLNVPGAGLVDIIERTERLAIRCPLVDALIATGILEGAPSDLSAMPPTGLCTEPDWALQPGWQAFAPIGRWILDPSEPANHLGKLAPRTYLVQKVIDDDVVPNYTTDQMCALLGQEYQSADIADALPGTPSTASTNEPSAGKCLEYGGNPANIYSHGSLLVPADGTAQAALANVQMQTDAITFLLLNL